MQTKRSNILHLLLLIGVGGVTIGPVLFVMLFSLWGRFMSVIQENEKIYYIPQTKMYLKLTYNSNKDIGYIYFSPHSNFSKSDSIDFIKLHRTSGNFTAEIHIIPSSDKTIYIIDEDRSLVEKYSCFYDLLHVQYLCDTLYVDVNSKIMPIYPNCYWTDSLSLKQDHIAIGSCSEKLLMSDVNNSIFKTMVEFDDTN